MQAPFFRALHALTIDDGDSWRSLAAGAFAAFHEERKMNAINRPVPTPQIEITKEAIIKASNVSKGSVDAMRKVLVILGPDEAAECGTWCRARQRADAKTGGKEMTEIERQTRLEEQADVWAD